jgi:4-hydroxybenzoyl-CoA reductase subunit beta
VLPLPIFKYHRPNTLAECVALLDRLGDKARLVAGGTDVLPNMKQGLFDPEHVIAIKQIDELRGITLEQRESDHDRIVIGAGTLLADVADSTLVRRGATALAEAAALVGGPHHRAMGTIGGNICLDTRCRYYNQTYFWRKSLGFCLKKDGTVCHVVKGGAKCVAAASNDTAPTLIALGAELHVLSSKGARVIAAGDFYTADGIKNTTLEPGEIVVRVAVPIVPHRASAFEKLRKRGAIDFPLLSIAARVDRDATGALSDLDVVVSALGARPRKLRATAKVLTNASALSNEDIAKQLADAAFAECKPLTNIDEEADWRRDMVPVHVRKAVLRALNP